MKKKLIWILALVLLLAVILTTAAIAVAGGTDDPLVALSYLTGAFKKSLMDEAQTQIDEQIDDAAYDIERQLAELDAATVQPARSSTGYWRVSFSAGETIEFDTGSELLLLSGGAKVTSGGLSDATSGTVLGEGAALAQNHLCICVTSGTMTITESAELLICE